MRWLLLKAIRGYQRGISPTLPPSCKYQPTCSQYAYDAVLIRGALIGGALAVWRLLRCNPWSKGGYDPAPTRREDAHAH